MRVSKPTYFFTLRIVIAVSCCLCTLRYSHAQEVPAGMKEQLVAYRQNAPQEKLFVHTDKNFYLTGETIWFKIYYADAGTHKPADLSKVAYVELLDHEGKAMLQAKIGLGATNGNGNGSLLLPSYLGSGNYMLRAYTQWMKNFDKAYFFQKPISVVNTSKRPDWQSLEKRESYSIRFFPEGGNLVYGLQSRVAFHITDQYGKGMEGEGFIVDQRNDTVARFGSHRFGMGSFDFLPQPSGEYKAFARLGNGKVISAGLPQPYRTGYVMRVQDIDKERMKLTITTNVDRASIMYLLAHTRQEMKIALAQHVNNGRVEWTIDKASLGEGVSHMTIFNEARQPVCERLFFRRPSGKMNIDVKTDSEDYGTRSKVSLNMLVQNERGQSVKADLSMAVFLVDSLQFPDAQTIENYFWLTSDLTGAVESPGYYFSAPSEEVNKAIDDLMLTHGWRRFRWQDAASMQKPAFEFLPEYEGLTINAKVVDKRTGNPARGILSYLSFADQQFQVSNAISNEKGQAMFVTRDVFGPQGLVLQTDSNSNRYRVDLLNPFAPAPDSLILPRFALPEKWKDQLIDHHFSAAISNTFQPVHVRQFLLPSTNDTAAFYGEPDRRFFLDDFTRFPTMEEVMREFVDAVRIRKDNTGKFYYEVMNLPAKLHFNAAPLILLDGVPIFNLEKLVAFDPLKIKKIEVVGRKYYWGNLTCSGIVSYSTYEGDLAGFELDPAALVVEFQGLQLQREFYHPDYSTPDSKSSRVPDTRNVLSWQPALVSSGRNIETSFYTSDLPGNYVIVVQGLSDTGVPGTATKMISVK